MKDGRKGKRGEGRTRENGRGREKGIKEERMEDPNARGLMGL